MEPYLSIIARNDQAMIDIGIESVTVDRFQGIGKGNALAKLTYGRFGQVFIQLGLTE